MKDTTPAWAVVRIDDDVQMDVNLAVTVKEVVFDEETAKQEVWRLTELNADKRCVYFAMPTRIRNDRLTEFLVKVMQK